MSLSPSLRFQVAICMRDYMTAVTTRGFQFRYRATRRLKRSRCGPSAWPSPCRYDFHCLIRRHSRSPICWTSPCIAGRRKSVPSWMSGFPRPCRQVDRTSGTSLRLACWPRGSRPATASGCPRNRASSTLTDGGSRCGRSSMAPTRS
uniref:Putative outer membrane protein n=1 Tax=Pseudomonas putida TaxID=303 RepID=Q706T4_PSEPU|nr:putative outer membrane protein [Pseudomonas putida]